MSQAACHCRIWHGHRVDLPRKNCWTVAEYAGDRTPDRMQRLLERVMNTLAVMRVVRDLVVEHLTDAHSPRPVSG